MDFQLTMKDSELLRDFSGVNNKNMERLESIFNVKVIARNGDIKISGADKNAVEKARSFLQELFDMLEKEKYVDNNRIKSMLDLCKDLSSSSDIKSCFSETSRFTAGSKEIQARSVNQDRYLKIIDKLDIVMAIGPAGTGKTYLAVAKSLSYLLGKSVSRIILARPIVEAGERLGFLPGRLEEKIDPYLRPLYDALFDMIGHERLKVLIERQSIEIAPLAYMRGRTFNDSFLILDEAQNATKEQMKMFLTRLGSSSKMVITGDITQIDLQNQASSGLVHADKILKEIDGIGFIRFANKDIVRHSLVKDIVKAYNSESA